MKPLHGRRSSIAEVTPSNSISKHTRYAVPKTLIASTIAGILSMAAHAQTAPNTPAATKVAAATGPATTAAATTAAADESNVPEMTEVVITGTMIKRVNAETAEAITVLKADSLKDQGVENLEQAISTLTSANPSVNVAASVGTFSGGGTYADLRGLGRARTLVLLDGQRVAVNAFDGQGIDLNGIPFSAIDTLQVLREGASALYGSDAIAGVINFITKKNYQGGTVQINFDHPQKAGGGSGEADFTFGHGDLVNDG